MPDAGWSGVRSWARGHMSSLLRFVKGRRLSSEKKLRVRRVTHNPGVPEMIEWIKKASKHRAISIACFKVLNRSQRQTGFSRLHERARYRIVCFRLEVCERCGGTSLEDVRTRTTTPLVAKLTPLNLVSCEQDLQPRVRNKGVSLRDGSNVPV